MKCNISRRIEKDLCIHGIPLKTETDHMPSGISVPIFKLVASLTDTNRNINFRNKHIRWRPEFPEDIFVEWTNRNPHGVKQQNVQNEHYYHDQDCRQDHLRNTSAKTRHFFQEAENAFPHHKFTSNHNAYAHKDPSSTYHIPYADHRHSPGNCTSQYWRTSPTLNMEEA